MCFGHRTIYLEATLDNHYFDVVLLTHFDVIRNR